MFISRLGSELAAALPRIRTALKDGQIVSSKHQSPSLDGQTTNRAVDATPPWLARVAAIKAAASHNVDTERKVVRMSEELKDLLREVKIRVSLC